MARNDNTTPMVIGLCRDERVETVEQDECVDIEKEEISPNL